MAMLRLAAGEDRLSALPDEMLTNILSRLPTIESVRTSTLARRWRDVFAAVPAIDITSSTRLARVQDIVMAVLLARESRAPIRYFRVAGIGREAPPSFIIDQWITTAKYSGVETLDLNLARRGTGMPVCPYTDDTYKLAILCFEVNALDFYIVPRFFPHAGLRHLRLVNCALCLPEEEEHPLCLGSLETLSLRRISGPEEALQRLVSACPHLAELTLEECPVVTRVRVQPTALHLRAFTMRCCHNTVEVFLDAPILRSLEYRGNVLPLSVTNWGAIQELTIHICESVLDSAEDSHKICEVVAMVERCINLKFLCLSAQPKLPLFPYRAWLPGLKWLELRWPFWNNLDITALVGIINNMNNLEVLTLIADRSQAEKPSTEKVVVSNDLLSAEVKSFTHKLRRIYLVGYSDQKEQRQLAEFLLRRATCTEKIYISFAASVAQGSESEALLVKETTSWCPNPLTKITFTHGDE